CLPRARCARSSASARRLDQTLWLADRLFRGREADDRDVELVLDVFDAARLRGDVLDPVLHRTVRHGAEKRHDAVFHFDHDVARIDSALVREAIAHVLAYSLIVAHELRAAAR